MGPRFSKEASNLGMEWSGEQVPLDTLNKSASKTVLITRGPGFL